MIPDELTVKQTSERIGKTVKTVRNMIVAGRLVARLVPAPAPYNLNTVASVESYEASQKQKARDHSPK